MMSWKHLVAALTIGSLLAVAPMADAATAKAKPTTTAHVTHKAPVKAKTAQAPKKSSKKPTPASKKKPSKSTKKTVTKKSTTKGGKKGTGWKHHPNA